MFTQIFHNKEKLLELYNAVSGKNYHNPELLTITTLRVRKYAEDMTIEAAVDRTIDECIREGILSEFLKKHKAEAKAMSIYEYNEEEHMRMEREDAFKEGHEAGLVEGHEAGLADGRSETLKLISKMSADGLGHMISRIGEEPEFYEEMVKKYLK